MDHGLAERYFDSDAPVPTMNTWLENEGKIMEGFRQMGDRLAFVGQAVDRPAQ
jgi:hypothetical protein